MEKEKIGQNEVVLSASQKEVVDSILNSLKNKEEERKIIQE